MLADIMGDEKKRTETPSDVAVSDRESEVLAETMAVMEEDAPKSSVAVTTDELENLFHLQFLQFFLQLQTNLDQQELHQQVQNQAPY